MNRQEHLEWCKQRALEYVDANDLNQAFASFHSDMSKHEETRTHKALDMGMPLLFSGHLDNPREMRKWINGFN